MLLGLFTEFVVVCWFKKGGVGGAEDTSIFKEMDVVNVFISLVERKRFKIQHKEEITDIARSYHQF